MPPPEFQCFAHEANTRIFAAGVAFLTKIGREITLEITAQWVRAGSWAFIPYHKAQKAHMLSLEFFCANGRYGAPPLHPLCSDCYSSGKRYH